MRLIPFENVDKFSKASEQHLPEDERRQSIAHVEQIMGRELTASEAGRFAQVAAIAPQMVPGDDPIELRPVRRITATSKPSMPGIKGGEDRSGAELEDDITPLAVGLIGAALCLIAAFCLRSAEPPEPPCASPPSSPVSPAPAPRSTSCAPAPMKPRAATPARSSSRPNRSSSSASSSAPRPCNRRPDPSRLVTSTAHHHGAPHG